MDSLSSERPVFHSEDDFKFSLAWNLKCLYPDVKIRLEVPCGSERVDIIVQYNGMYYPVEVKYKKARFEYTQGGELFKFSDDTAYTQNHPKLINDIRRIEKHSESLNKGLRLGFAIWLTNDHIYWDGPQSSDANYAPYTVKEGVVLSEITGEMDDIMLQGKYSVHWEDYSEFETRNGWFRYALIRIE